MSNALWTILDNVRIQDLLDIVIISALIYVILVWFEKAASRISEGEQAVEFTRDAVKIPSNLSLEGIKPERIPLTAHRLLPWEVRLIDGKPLGVRVAICY
jgi:hypothetical protein